ncbi:AAA family ATPase [bacterium]|nr:AAA family ATPase [bacterium]MBU1882761.1 AAA family ATPase [bacterium]
MKIDEITIKNYKSIKEINELKLTNLNILIGSNGAGKSNFISFFKMLNELIEKKFQEYVMTQAGADNILHFGSKVSSEIYAKVDFGINKYALNLKPDSEDKLFIAEEHTYYNNSHSIIGSAEKETQLFNKRGGIHTRKGVADYIIDALQSWKVYHFHDTSSTALVKKTWDVDDKYRLRYDASNLASFLYRLSNDYGKEYTMIEETIKLVAPYFDKFVLKPDEKTNTIRLGWYEKGSDKLFNANHLSDGTLRMICLTTLLLQPNAPDTIIIDEPELGLHPYAITVLASLMKSFAINKQLIVSTQSVTLINHFKEDDIIVTDKIKGASVFRRLEQNELKEWIEDYSLGEIWEKNLIGGRP